MGEITLHDRFKVLTAQLEELQKFAKNTPALQVDDDQRRMHQRLIDHKRIEMTELAFKIFEQYGSWDSTPADVKGWISIGMDQEETQVVVCG